MARCITYRGRSGLNVAGAAPNKGEDPAQERPAEKEVAYGDRYAVPVFTVEGNKRGKEIDGEAEHGKCGERDKRNDGAQESAKGVVDFTPKQDNEARGYKGDNQRDRKPGGNG